MSTKGYQNFATSPTTPTFGFSSLAASATVGRKSNAVTLIDGSNRVPERILIRVKAVWTTGTVGSSKTLYLFASSSSDGTNYSGGPTAVSAGDAGYTFGNAPTSNPAPGFTLIGTIQIVAQSETHEMVFYWDNPPRNIVFIVLNDTGVNLTTGCTLVVQPVDPETV